jgi:hypothetical protein
VQREGSPWLFVLAVAAAAAYVWLSSQSLPPVVASHFGASGAANGFMRRDAYAWFMVALTAVIPALLVFLPGAAMSSPRARINLPNRDYWLAPERREETLAYLRGTTRRFGYLLLGFLAYAHWLVVRANAVVPPRLDSAWFIGGLVVLLLACALWIAGMFRRFGRVPR